MKSKEQIQKELEQLYKRRFLLRYARKTKKCCKNCKKSHAEYFDLGEFGKHEKYTCSRHDAGINCQFECKWTEEDIEKEMLNDISNPSICGAKEPKIAALLWVLHDGQEKIEPQTGEQSKPGFFARLRGLFR